jgi:hypothetical protein
MSVISNEVLVSLSEASKAVHLYGKTNTIIMVAEPGIGKTTTLSGMAEFYNDKWRRVGDEYPSDTYLYVYVDVPGKDLGDVFMNIPVHDTKSLEQYAAALFKMDDPRPKIIMLDEYAKAPKMLQVIFTRLMLERSLGDVQLPEGSIVFGTSNNASDGVGDALLAHGINRVTILKVAKPNAEQYAVWATNNGVHPALRGWAMTNRSAFASYLTMTPEQLDANPFVFNPRKTGQSFLSPRSLTKCDTIVRNLAVAGENLTRAALAGTVGQAAGDSILAYMALEKEIYDVRDCINDPMGTPIPTKLSALFLMLFNAVDVIETQDDLTGFMQYMDRSKSSELESLWFMMVTQSSKTAPIANRNERVKEWIKTNFALIV